MFELVQEAMPTQGRVYKRRLADVGPRPRKRSGPTTVSSQSGLRLTFLQDAPALAPASPMRSVQLALKRAMDVLLSAIALIVLAPALVAIALSIWATSAGPIVFYQTREGFNGKPIKVYKFRTMYTDRCDISGIAQTASEDNRITSIGRFLRRKSLDELPQLFNIFKGEMSLIGPRPHVFGMLAGGTTYERLVPYYTTRQTMKPGLSGWAQANGLRGPTDNAAQALARVDHDLAYIENFSLLLDIKIIWKTLRQEFLSGTGL